MTDLSARALRVAMYGFVPADDPHVIADMQAKIESDAKVIAAQDKLLARAANRLNISSRMADMDLGSEITEYRRQFLATNEQTAEEIK